MKDNDNNYTSYPFKFQPTWNDQQFTLSDGSKTGGYETPTWSDWLAFNNISETDWTNNYMKDGDPAASDVTDKPMCYNPAWESEPCCCSASSKNPDEKEDVDDASSCSEVVPPSSNCTANFSGYTVKNLPIPGNCYLKDAEQNGMDAGWCNKYGTTFDTGEDNLCCISSENCRPTPRWNWILGTCKGMTCGGNNQADPSTDPWGCIHGKEKDSGTQVSINYVAAYQFDGQKWVRDDESSFNADGTVASPFDPMANGAWPWSLPGPNPGGAAFWNNGFSPVGAKGLTYPAMMFLLSVNKAYNFTFYVVNQQTLNRGASVPAPGNKPNTWGCNNSGEWDFIETPWNNASAPFGNSYTTINNQGAVGRCLQMGNCTGGFGSTKYLPFDTVDSNGIISQPTKRVFAMIIDRTGAMIYNLPAASDGSTAWTGITLTKADATLTATAPDFTNFKANSTGAATTDFTGVFVQHGQALDAKNRAVCNTGMWGTDHGWCDNILVREFMETGNIWPAAQGQYLSSCPVPSGITHPYPAGGIPDTTNMCNPPTAEAEDSRGDKKKR